MIEKDEVPNEYYKSIQSLFNTGDVEFVINRGDSYIFDVKGEFLVLIKKVGEGNWTMKIMN